MKNFRKQMQVIIFGTDTYAGKFFDLILIGSILLSIIIVLIDSVYEYHIAYGNILIFAEWIFTILFSAEYFLRIYCARNPFIYIFSFFGIIDFLAIIPTYLSLFMPGTEVLSVIRIFRVLRVFRILKLAQYIGEAELLINALIDSKRKIFIFLFFILNLVIILGSIMYLIEGETPGFTSIPKSIYWAIVTLTTVGYGDISPETAIGQTIAAIIMIMGYCIIAVPTGIVTSEINFAVSKAQKKNCTVCGNKGINQEARYCSACGIKLSN